MKTMMKTGILIGSMGMLGFMYLKKHPEVIYKTKQTIRDTSKNIYDMMDESMII